MVIEIKDKKIISAEPDVLNISSYSQTIKLTGDIPTTALVEMHINNLTWDLWFPLRFKDDHFEANIIIPENMIRFMKSNQARKYSMFFTVNQTIIGGAGIEVVLNFDKLEKDGRTIVENDYKVLLQEIALLKRKIDTYITKNHTDGIHISGIQGAKEGMIPILMDSAGHLRFDYPFADLTSQMQSLVQSNIKIVDMMTSLTERVNKNELALHEHVNANVFGG